MSENNVHFYDFGDFRLDLVNYRLLENGTQVPLTQKSFELLHHLIENRARVLKKEELLNDLWEGNFVEEANLTQHVYMLRKALGQKGAEHQFIETIPKTGYRFVADVSEVVAVNGKELALEAGLPLPDDHFQDTADALREIDDSGEGFFPLSAIRVTSPRQLLAGISLVLVCGMLVAAVIYFSGMGRSISGGKRAGSLAVLPFKQISGEKDEKLGLGIADVIIAKLANLENVAVRPTTSIIRYADENSSDLFEVGQKLNVDYVIEGSIQRENGKVRVTSQLYSVAEKKQVWTESFDEEYKDIFSLQDAISERIAQKVAIGLERGERDFPFKQLTTDRDAYTAYSTGLSYWSQHTKVGFESAIVHFERAIERDPRFVLAYAYLADTYGHYQYLSELMDRETALRKGEESVDQALKLDPQCAEALAAKALILAIRNRGHEAFELMKTSIKLKPNDAHSRHRLAWMYADLGDLETAVSEMIKALDEDPQSTYLNLYLSNFNYLKRDAKEARKYCQKALDIDRYSEEAKWRMLLITEEEGKLSEVERTLKPYVEKNAAGPSVKLFLSRVYAKQGDVKAAKKLLDEVEKHKDAKAHGLETSIAYAAIGDRERAMSELQEAVRNEQVELFVLRYTPGLDPLRTDPRFGSLVRDLEVSKGWIKGKSG